MFDFPIQVYIGACFVGFAVPLLWWSVSAPRTNEAAGNRIKSGYSTDLRDVVLAQSGQERVVSPMIARLASMLRRRSPSGVVEALERKVALAGMTATWPIDRVLGMKLLLGIAGSSLGLLRFVAQPTAGRLIAAAVLSVAGFWGIDYLLSVRGRRRQDALSQELPDVLDQMTISVEAGLGLEPALMQIVDHAEGPIAEEFSYVVRDIRLGMGRERAFRAMTDRTDVPELRSFVAAMVQADKLGAPLANVMRLQAGEMRLIRRQRAEEEAQKLPLKMIFPLILCILPALVMVLLGPAIIDAIDGFSKI
ncbi:MAG: type II secretion system F family protein [Acidimicrobiales bacterium]